MRANVKLLTIQWQMEVNKLQDAINLIMDSAAYCQVNCLLVRNVILPVNNSRIVYYLGSFGRSSRACLDNV